MAGYRVNNYDTSTANITSLMETIDATRTGYIALSLTEYDSTVVPAIAGGSLVEVAGSLFRFSTTEAISTTGVTSTAAQMYYIRLVPTSSQCSAQFSTTASAWREDLQGYYHSTTSNNRVVGGTYFTGADYLNKALYRQQDIIRASFADGLATFIPVSTVIGVSSTVTVNMSAPITNINSISMQGFDAQRGQMKILNLTINSSTVNVEVGYASTTGGLAAVTHSIFVSGASR